MMKLNDYLRLNYKMEIVEDPDEGGYAIALPELPGCLSTGETIEEAVKMIEDALYSHLSACLDAGVKIQEPLKPVDYKGQIPYRTTPEKHYKLAKKSAATSKSINKLIDEAVDAYLESA